MIFLKRFFDFILFGNFYVSLGAVCLIQSTSIQLKFTNQLFWYSLLVFFATLFIYNFQRVFYNPKVDTSLNSIRRKWIFENQKNIKILSLIGLIGVFVSFFFNNFKIVLYLSPLLILSIAYFIPFIKLRKNAWFKLLTLVFVWTMVTAVVPILLNQTSLFEKNNLLHIALRFCFMMGICIPFDIRDLLIDKMDNVSTLPHLIGENKTRWLAVAFMVLYILIIASQFIFGMMQKKIIIILLITAFVNTLLVFMSNSKRNEYFYIAGIDGTMILQGCALIIVHYFF